jgi:aryl-alcohol dehydrogenase
MRATAAVLRDAGEKYSLEDVDLPDPAADELLVRIVSAGICHTDSLLRSVPGFRLPMIAGHEGAGVVEAVGPHVKGIVPGDHVVLSFDHCGGCRNCRSANPAYCDEFMVRNFAGYPLDGSAGAVDLAGESVGWRWFGQSSFATHAIATARNAVVVTKDADLRLLGPLGCGIQTGAGSILNALQVTPGSALVVFGAGAVGLAAVMAGHLAGASQIIAVDRHPHRLDLALSVGATSVIVAAADTDVAGEVRELTHGGADFSFDTTGVSSVIVAAVECLRMTGSCGLVGAGSEPIELGAGALMGRTVSGILEGGTVPQLFIPQLIDHWMAGRFPFEKLIETYDLAAIDEAEEASLSGKVVKPVLLPSA